MKGYVASYQTKAGRRWRITYDLPPDPVTGKRRQKTRRGFRTQGEANAALRNDLSELDKGPHIDTSRATLAEYLIDEWLPSREPQPGASGRRHRGRLGVGTHAAYTRDIETYVVSRIGQIPLRALTAEDLDHLYDQLETEGGRHGQPLSAKTVANVHGVVHKALADAVRRGLLTRNVAAAVEPPRPPRPKTEVWDVHELRKFLSTVRSDRLYAVWLLLATTGMRRGEVMGLSWDDIDLEAGTVRVTWTLGNIDARLTWKPRPKSKAARRVMSLDPATVEALQEHRERQRRERRLAGSASIERNEDWQGIGRERVVFTWPDGRMIDPELVTKWFRQHCRSAGLRRIRLHDLRHTYATAALQHATGWHEVKVISQRLGHASVGITLDTYSHVLPAADEETAHTLAALILGNDGP